MTAGTIELTRERRITADPTSLALLLAGPSGVDLWPGTRRRGEVRGRLIVDADLSAAVLDKASVAQGHSPSTQAGKPPQSARLIVRAAAPRRTPAAFVLNFGWEPDSDCEQPDAVVGGSATLALGYDGAHETRAALRITLTGHADEARASMVGGMAGGFLDNLAAAAAARSHAA